MKIFLVVMFISVLSVGAHAQEALLEESLSVDREPASTNAYTSSSTPTPTPTLKRTYPGGADEEDLQVQAHLPEAALKMDARYLQREVYKSLYNQELKDEGRESVEE